MTTDFGSTENQDTIKMRQQAQGLSDEQLGAMANQLLELAERGVQPTTEDLMQRPGSLSSLERRKIAREMAHAPGYIPEGIDDVSTEVLIGLLNQYAEFPLDSAEDAIKHAAGRNDTTAEEVAELEGHIHTKIGLLLSEQSYHNDELFVLMNTQLNRAAFEKLIANHEIKLLLLEHINELSPELRKILQPAEPNHTHRSYPDPTTSAQGRAAVDRYYDGNPGDGDVEEDEGDEDEEEDGDYDENDYK